MRKKFLVDLVCVLMLSFFCQMALADIATVTAFNLDFDAGESFAVQDEYRLTTFTFNIESGTLNGTATLSLDSGQGLLVITPGANSLLSISGYSPTSTVYVNSAIYSYDTNISLTKSVPVTIMWKAVTAVIIGDGEIANLYFRSDSFTTLGVTTYGLSEEYTNINTAINSSAVGPTTIQYGFRVWLVTNSTTFTELTSGTPIATISLAANTTGYQSSTWAFPGSQVILGYQALEVGVYEKQGAGLWTAKGNFITNILLTDYLVPSTWTFQLYVDYEVTADTASAFVFGSSNYKSGLYGFTFLPPLESEIQWWRISKGDLIGFIIGGYVDIIGEAFYVLILLGVAGSMYRRFGHAGTIAFFFVIFGGVGGVVWLFVPSWAAIVVGSFVIMSVSFIVWRLIR